MTSSLGVLLIVLTCSMNALQLVWKSLYLVWKSSLPFLADRTSRSLLDSDLPFLMAPLEYSLGLNILFPLYCV